MSTKSARFRNRIGTGLKMVEIKSTIIIFSSKTLTLVNFTFVQKQTFPIEQTFLNAEYRENFGKNGRTLPSPISLFRRN